MNIFNEVKESIHNVVHSVFPSVKPETLARMTVEPPRDASHGDMATNAAMILAKELGKNPRDLASELAARIGSCSPIIKMAATAGPGFVNITLNPEAFKNVLAHALTTGAKDFGNSTLGGKHKVNVEYVSANPTGPLTVGHARGAIFGDAVANLMAKAGYAVQKEYYINDAGKQVEVLTDSVILRIREASGEDIGEIPAGCYPGEYLKDVAKAYLEKNKSWDDRKAVRDFAIAFLLNEIKTDLGELGVKHDVFISEAEILKSGAVDDAMKQLTALGLIYQGVLEPPKGKTPDDWEPREQTLFRSTDFGDDVDRPLKKSDGSTTYFANDIAHYYHMHKMGYDTLVNVVGADHGGYVKRAKAAVKAITEGKATLDLPLVSIVHVTDNGQPVRMSKRAGTFITLRDMMDRVGAGVMRFIMLTREAGQTLEFDYTRVTEQSKDNPYFYVQYAHARCCSVLRHAKDMFGDVSDDVLAKADLSVLGRPEEAALLKLIATWPRIVEQAAVAEEPHRVAYFAQDVAAAFHGWWNRGRDDGTLRFLIEGDKPLSLARVALVRGVALTIASALGVIGVKPLEELRSDVEVEAA